MCPCIFVQLCAEKVDIKWDELMFPDLSQSWSANQRPAIPVPSHLHPAQPVMPSQVMFSRKLNFHLHVVCSLAKNTLIHFFLCRENITRGLWAISPPKCKKEPSEIKKEPQKIAMDCNVKACSVLQI